MLLAIDDMTLKIIFAVISSLLVFGYMLYLQKKKQEFDLDNFNKVMKGLADKYDDERKKNAQSKDKEG